MTDTDLAEFGRDLVQDVLSTAEATDSTTPDAYTERMVEHLTDAGEIDEGIVCYHRRRGIEVNGYGWNEAGDRIDLFVSHFEQDPAPTVSRTEMQVLAKRARGFLEMCANGYASELEDATQAFDMAVDLSERLKLATSARVLLLTNSSSKARTVDVEPIGDLKIESHVWDLERLHRLVTSGTLHEPIEVDFVRRFGSPLKCLTSPDTNADYSILLALIPGAVLARLYDEFGTRLLELNVRSFLQAKGAVNRGIRDTLLNAPEKFLAYNNGISATASSVKITELDAGGQGIVRLTDLQIVNGGQTTASIHSADAKDKADLSAVLVQAKIAIVSPEKIADVVPEISRFSNTQNKVTTADFSSNHPFHVEVEKVSRAVWAPSAVGDRQESHWFYERARGQYADEQSRQRTPARIKAWRVSNPPRQKFTKTDLAKFEASFDQLPHLVSRGAEKNFREFMMRLGDGRGRHVDEVEFRKIIAKAILFRETERIVTAQDFGGYRANIVTYSLAKLSKATSRRIDLNAIWESQGLSEPLRSAMADLSRLVHAEIVRPKSGSANVSEWCKRPEAWARIADLTWDVPVDLESELIALRAQREQDAQTRVKIAVAPVSTEVEAISKVPEEVWFAVANWAKETNSLQAWQRGIAFSLGKLASRESDPSVKQARQGEILLREAIRLGFQPPSEVPAEFKD